MIYSQSVQYQLKKPIEKVHYFEPAFNDSLVVVATRNIGSDYLGHYNAQGQELYSICFGDLVDTLAMPNDRTAIVLRVEEGLIYQINLESKTHQIYKHFFMTDVSCQVSLNFFCETNLICIQENGDHNNHKMTMTYYKFPFQVKGDFPPIISSKFIGNEDVWDPSFFVQKVNSHSKYAWYQTRHKNVFELRMLQLTDDQQNRKQLYRTVNVNMNSLFEPYGLLEMEAAIVELWEFRPNVMLLFCSTSKNNKVVIDKTKQVINNTFLWDTQLGTIRQSKFTLPPERQDLQIDIVGSPQLSMFRTFFFENGKAVQAPAYFVSNSKEQIVMEQSYICSHLQKYKVLERNTSTILEGIFPNSNVNEFKLRIISLLDRKDMSFFLQKELEKKQIQYNEAWDYELLADISKMLDYSEFN